MALNTVTTPQEVEQMLLRFSKELDQATEDLARDEFDAFQAEMSYKAAVNRAVINRAYDTVKRTVKLLEAEVDEECEPLERKHKMAALAVKNSKDNIIRIRSQIDLVRSLGTAVRSAMDLS